MNKTTSLVMASALLISGATGCKDKTSGTEPIIEKPEVTVVNGQFTPELLEAFGRVTDPQVSPDEHKIIYGRGYESVEQTTGNRELWIMDIHGENQKRL
ncbi:MAG: peptidase S9, partial [Muribaculaceae bacterium]|nr:peptidase S9 [Muribaculaceae bacterium]